MSKYVKDLVTTDLKKRWENVNDLLLVNLIGLDAIRNTLLRKELRDKDIHLIVVKNSLARRATEGTALAPAFEGSKGMLAVVWGASDVVALAKEVTRLAGDKKFAPFEPKGGVMSGSPLTAAEVKLVSKWPSREEQLSILMGQILSPGAVLAGQLSSAGGALASQIKQHGEREEAGGAEAVGGEAPAVEAPETDAPPSA